MLVLVAPPGLGYTGGHTGSPTFCHKAILCPEGEILSILLILSKKPSIAPAPLRLCENIPQVIARSASHLDIGHSLLDIGYSKGQSCASFFGAHVASTVSTIARESSLAIRG